MNDQKEESFPILFKKYYNILNLILVIFHTDETS